MFSAFVIVCAAAINSEVDWSTCVRFNDSWGPYKTEENCIIRSKQMHTEVTVGSLKDIAFSYLNNPEGLLVQGFCEKLPEDEAA